MADFANARGRPAPTRSSREDDQDDEPQQLLFDCSGIKSKADFWDKFLDFIGAMEDHGTNLDALADSMTGGCSDKLEPPYVLTMQNVAKASGPGLKMIETVAEYALEDDMVELGVVVKLENGSVNPQ